MSDEHDGPSNDKPWVAGLAIAVGLGLALGVGRVDPYGPAGVQDGAEHALKVSGLETIEGTVHSHGAVLQVHTPEGLVFLPRDKARIVESNKHSHGLSHGPAGHSDDGHTHDDAAHSHDGHTHDGHDYDGHTHDPVDGHSHDSDDGESVSEVVDPLDQLAIRAFNRLAIHDEAIPLYAELVARGEADDDPRLRGWLIRLGELVESYAKEYRAGNDHLQRAHLVRDALKPLRSTQTEVWLTDAYAQLLINELAREQPRHQEALGDMLRAQGPSLTQRHRGVLEQLHRRNNPVHEGGGLIPPGR